MTARHYSNSQNLVISFEYSWFLAKNLSYFVSLPWKLHNRKCHTAGDQLVTAMLTREGRLCPPHYCLSPLPPNFFFRRCYGPAYYVTLAVEFPSICFLDVYRFPILVVWDTMAYIGIFWWLFWVCTPISSYLGNSAWKNWEIYLWEKSMFSLLDSIFENYQNSAKSFY